MSLLITRPEYDLATKYLYYWSEDIITTAEKKGMNVIDLKREKANRKELEGRISKLHPRLILLNGHGNDETISGQNDLALIQAGDNEEILQGCITYAVSCRCGKKLGPQIAKYAWAMEMQNSKVCPW